MNDIDNSDVTDLVYYLVDFKSHCLLVNLFLALGDDIRLNYPRNVSNSDKQVHSENEKECSLC